MKLDINTLIKYAYSSLPENDIEKIEELLSLPEYELEFEAADSIINIGIREKMSMHQMQIWIKENASLFIKNLKNVEKDNSDSFVRKIKEFEQRLIKWFDETILLNHPALELSRTRSSSNTIEVCINEHLNAEIQLNFTAQKPVKFSIEDTEGIKVINTKLKNNETIDLAGLMLHAGAYLWIANSSEIDLHYGVFYVDEYLKPKQS